MPYEGVCSVPAWWHPELMREQVRLCDKSMMERSLKKSSVCAPAPADSTLIVLPGSPSCCWDYGNKRNFPQPPAQTLCKYEITSTEPFQCQRLPVAFKEHSQDVTHSHAGLLCPAAPRGTEGREFHQQHSLQGIFLHPLPKFCFLAPFMLLFTQGNGVALLSLDPEALNSSVPLTRSQSWWLPSLFTIPWKHLSTQTTAWWLKVINTERRKVQKTSRQQLFPVDKTYPCSTCVLCPRAASSAPAAQWRNSWHSQSSSWNSSVCQALREPKAAQGGLLLHCGDALVVFMQKKSVQWVQQ